MFRCQLQAGRPPSGHSQAVDRDALHRPILSWSSSWMAAGESYAIQMCWATSNRRTCTSCPACLQVHFREASALVEGPLSNLKQSLVQLSRPIRVRHGTPYRPAACGACAPCARWHLGTPPEHPAQLCCHHCHGPAQPDGLLHVWHNTHPCHTISCTAPWQSFEQQQVVVDGAVSTVRTCLPNSAHLTQPTPLSPAGL